MTPAINAQYLILRTIFSVSLFCFSSYVISFLFIEVIIIMRVLSLSLENSSTHCHYFRRLHTFRSVHYTHIHVKTSAAERIQ